MTNTIEILGDTVAAFGLFAALWGALVLLHGLGL